MINMAERGLIKKIRIGKLTTTPYGIAALILAILMIVGTFLPWVYVGFILEPTRTYEAYMGRFIIELNGYGMGYFANEIYYIDSQGQPILYEGTGVSSMLNTGILIFGLITIISAIYFILYFLKESGIRVPVLENIFWADEKREFIVSMIFGGLAYLVVFLFSWFYDSLPLATGIYDNVEDFLVSAFLRSSSLSAEVAGTARVVMYIIGGPGYILATFSSVFILILMLHRYIFAGKLILRKSWKLRLWLIMITLLTGIFPWARIVNAMEFSTIGLTNDMWALMFVVFMAFSVFLIVFAAMRASFAVLMKEEEFISFDLPPEELSRRISMLPYLTHGLKLLRRLLTILFIIPPILFYLSTRAMLKLHFLYIKDGIGYLFTEYTAWIPLIASIFLFLVHIGMRE